jgi:hypothetical protein
MRLAEKPVSRLIREFAAHQERRSSAGRRFSLALRAAVAHSLPESLDHAAGVARLSRRGAGVPVSPVVALREFPTGEARPPPGVPATPAAVITSKFKMDSD